jgi:hypothetical protein
VAEFQERHDLEEASRLARATWEEWFAPGRFHRFLCASLEDAGLIRPGRS